MSKGFTGLNPGNQAFKQFKCPILNMLINTRKLPGENVQFGGENPVYYLPAIPNMDIMYSFHYMMP